MRYLDITLRSIYSFDLDSNSIAVLVNLAAQGNCKTDHAVAFPSLLSLSLQTGLSKRTVQRTIDALVEAGLLRTERRHDLSNRYHLQLSTTDVPPPPTDDLWFLRRTRPSANLPSMLRAIRA